MSMKRSSSVSSRQSLRVLNDDPSHPKRSRSSKYVITPNVPASVSMSSPQTSCSSKYVITPNVTAPVSMSSPQT